MNPQLPAISKTAEEGEFVRLAPSLIKIEAGMLGRKNLGDLGPLKSAIAWRERRQKGSGLLQPLLVSGLAQTGYYKLEDGLRRFTAVLELMEEGLTIETIPVRVLPAPLTTLERLVLLSSDGKPLEVLEQAELIEKLTQQGLDLGTLADVWGLSVEHLERRRALLKLKTNVRRAMQKGTIAPEIVEGFWKSRGVLGPVLPAEIDAAQAYFSTSEAIGARMQPIVQEESARPLGECLGLAPKQKASPVWMSKVFDPSYHYVALSGLYEWMGASHAAQKGYSRKVVGIIELMLHYCGGKMTLTQIAEALKKIK